MYDLIPLKKIEEELDKLDGKESKQTQLVTEENKNYFINLVRFDEQSEVLSEMHELASDIYIITSGSCKLTLGGTLINKKDLGEGNWLGKGIEGGETHHVQKGDMISIPPNTPHMVDIDGKAVSYVVVKVFNKTI